MKSEDLIRMDTSPGDMSVSVEEMGSTGSDPFATGLNYQSQAYIFPAPDGMALTVDAMLSE